MAGYVPATKSQHPDRINLFVRLRTSPHLLAEVQLFQNPANRSLYPTAQPRPKSPEDFQHVPWRGQGTTAPSAADTRHEGWEFTYFGPKYRPQTA